MKEASNSFLDEIKVEDNMRPDYNNCLTYYQSQEDSSELFIFRDKKVKKLYILESRL